MKGFIHSFFKGVAILIAILAGIVFLFIAWQASKPDVRERFWKGFHEEWERTAPKAK